MKPAPNQSHNTVTLDLGGVVVHVVTDGFFRLDAGTLFGMVPRAQWAAVAPPDGDHCLWLAIRSLVIEWPGDVVVVEAGFGSKLDAEAVALYGWDNTSTLAERLAELAIDPARVSLVVQTHLHIDHAGGLTRHDHSFNPRPVFPNARVVVQQAELDAALNPNALTQGSYNDDDIRPLVEAGLADFVKGQAEPRPGLVCLPTGGHSAGHQAVRIDGKNASLLYPGDVLPTWWNLPPAWISAYDLDPQATLRAKKELCAAAALRGAYVVAVHDPVHPVCRIALKNKRFSAIPVAV